MVGAMFVDSGEAVNDIRESNFKTGAGVGVLAVAGGAGEVGYRRARGDKDTHGMQFYIGLGLNYEPG